MAAHILAQIFSRLQLTTSETTLLQIMCYAGDACGKGARLPFEVQHG